MNTGIRQETETLRISIGGLGDGNFHIVETNAPRDYDGFGTIHISQYGPDRIVLIREEHFTWQTARYQSGMHQWNKPDYGPPDVIAEELWKRLQQREAL